MKKLLSLVLALMMCAGVLPVMAETGVIGGADGPTEIVLTGPDIMLPGDLGEDALAAGRKVQANLAVTEVSGIDTGDASVDAALTELFKALGFTMTQQGDEGAFSLTISGNDVLSMGLAVSGEDAYVQSNLLGGTVVVGASEVTSLVERLLDMLVMMESITEEDAAELKAQAGVLVTTLSAALQNSDFQVTLTDADLLAMDYSAVVTVLGEIMQKMQPVENIVVPKNCDAAVGGVTLNATNEDMQKMSMALIQFIKDNPKLMRFLAYQFGMSTRAQLTTMWEAMKDNSIYATEEEFLQANPAVEDVLDEAMSALEDRKILDGDYVIQVYYDEAGLPVYATFMVPVFIQAESLYTDVQTESSGEAAGENEIIASPSADMLDEMEPKGETKVVEIVYARQTVAQGVSHVVNITVDGEMLTIDTLISGKTAHIVLSVPEEEPVIIDAAVEGNKLTAVLSASPDEATAITCTLEGSYLCSDTDYELMGKFTLTEVYTPVETETPSVNGMALPGFESKKPQPRTTTFELDFAVDYVRNGVDFTGVTDLAFAFNDVHVALQMNVATADPADSIMAGTVVRPAELDDAAFANWFVGVVNTFSSWTGNLMMALPESVLTVLFSGGMM